MVKVTRKRAEDLLKQDTYSIRELATLLQTTEDFINREIWRKNLKALHVDGVLTRVKRSDVLEWIAVRENGHRSDAR